jgi:hypothetical protein
MEFLKHLIFTAKYGKFNCMSEESAEIGAYGQVESELSEAEKKVLEAIRDKQWDYRTVEGVRNHVHIDVNDVLPSFNSLAKRGLIKAAPFKNKDGKVLYYSPENKSYLGTIFDAFRSER